MSALCTIMENWFQRVWTELDTKAIDEMFIANGKASGLGSNILVGPEEVKQFHSALSKLLTDFDITIDKSIESGNWISLLCTLRATSKQSGEPVEMTGAGMVKIENGVLVEAYNHWDFLGLFVQLKLLPNETFETALNGQQVFDRNLNS